MTEIAVTPSGEVGSIGVFAVHEDVSKAAELAGVKTTLISAGPFKTEGNEFEPLTDEARTHIQSQVDQFYAMFLHDVASGRRVSAETVAGSYGEGRTLLAKPALEAGMVDRIQTLEATIAGLQHPVASVRKAAAIVSPEPAAIAASMTVDRAWNARIAKQMKRSFLK
jgi:ClpP class serine protease